MMEARARKRRKTDTKVWAIENLTTLESAAKPFQISVQGDGPNWSVHETPFPLLQFHDLFDDAFLRKVKEELSHLEYFARSSDLFSYSGTHELPSSSATALGKLRSALISPELQSVLETITGVELTGGVDMSSHIYSKGNSILLECLRYLPCFRGLPSLPQ